MATLTADMKTFIENNLAWITTVDKDGNLDLGPKMSMFVLDDNHLAYHERTAGQHYRNLQDGSPLVVAVANLAEKKGYRFRGTVTLHTDDDIYDAQVKVAEEKGTKKPAAIPVLEITEIQDLSSGAGSGDACPNRAFLVFRYRLSCNAVGCGRQRNGDGGPATA